VARDPEAGSGSRSADHWQRKYYQSLDELEKKEQQWQRLEFILRRLATRLSLAIDGQEAALDKQLETLRVALRDEHNPHRLEKLIEEVIKRVSRLDPTSSPQAQNSDQSGVLLKLLDELNIPPALERQSRYVRKKLLRESAGEELDARVKELAELLSLVIDQISETRLQKHQQQAEPPSVETTQATTQTQATSQAGSSSGLFSGLFGRKTHQQDVVQNEAPSPIQANPPESKEGDTAQLGNEAAPASGASDTPEVSALALAAETLICLLEKLQLPGDLHLQADLIKQRLEPCNDEEQLADGLKDTVEVVAGLHQRAQQDKKELEDFLRQLTGRLAELDQDIRETTRLRQQSQQAGKEVDQHVRQEVDSIELQIQQTQDLEMLKTAVQSRVIIIRDHMDHFLHQEESRHDRASRIIDRLNLQLEDTRGEVEQLRQQVVDAQLAAMRDQLTGIANRLAYDRAVSDELARFSRYASCFCLMVWDVDKFKNINDNYGHAAGDKVLAVLANVMQQSVRETDHLARYGGEEFVILLPETLISQAPALADKLRQAIGNTAFHFRGERVVITASCGLAEVRTGETALQLFSRADAALYRAKQGGRNCVELAE